MLILKILTPFSPLADPYSRIRIHACALFHPLIVTM